MSIINDALKKLQSQRQESIPMAAPAADASYRNIPPQKTSGTETAARADMSAPAQASRPSAERAFSRSLFMYVLIIVCGLVAFSLLKMPESTFPATAGPAIPAHSAPAVVHISTVQKTVKATHGSANVPIALHGIMLTGDTPAALINNEVYQVGDTVSDMFITAILEDRVILSQGSKEIVLKVNGKR